VAASGAPHCLSQSRRAGPAPRAGVADAPRGGSGAGISPARHREWTRSPRVDPEAGATGLGRDLGGGRPAPGELPEARGPAAQPRRSQRSGRTGRSARVGAASWPIPRRDDAGGRGAGGGDLVGASVPRADRGSGSPHWPAHRDTGGACADGYSRRPGGIALAPTVSYNSPNGAGCGCSTWNSTGRSGAPSRS
jgi:hypothetical protein